MKNFSQSIFLSGLFIFLLIPGISGAQNNSEDNSNVRSEIEDAYRDFSKNLQEGNAEGVAAHYTEDAKFYPPNGGVATGKQEISSVFNGFIQQGIHVELEVKELEVFGDVAYEYGIATVKNQQGNNLGQNEYVVLWKKEQGDWKIHRDFIKDKAPE